jgi:hypothetical protein
MQSLLKSGLSLKAAMAIAVLAAACFALRASAQVFVGGGDAPTYDTTPTVTLLDHSGEAGGRLVIDIINGHGMNTKTTHENSSASGIYAADPFGRMALFRGKSHNNPGTVVGSNWAKFQFNAVYPLSNIWFWNWNEDGGGGGDNTRFGWKHVTVEYSLTGGPNPAEWTKADLLLGASGDNIIPEASGVNGAPADLIAPFSSTGPVLAQYVVITNTGAGSATPGTPDPTAEITWGGDDGAGDAGLSEVRFEIVPEPGSLALLGIAGLSMLRRRR